MSSTRIVSQTAFSAGELSLLMDDRIDKDRYASGCRRLLNMLAWPHGAVTRRPGWDFIIEAGAPEGAAGGRQRLMSFRFSIIQAYILEWGQRNAVGYLRFFKDEAGVGGVIVALATTAEITNGSFLTGISGWADESGAGSAISYDGTLKCMNLDSNGSTTAAGEQGVAHTSGGVEHVLAFRVVTGPVSIRIGTTSGDDDIFALAHYSEGSHTVDFTPPVGNTTFYVRFEYGDTDALKKVTGIRIFDDEGVELWTPYSTEEHLVKAKNAQSEDVVYLAKSGIYTYKLIRYSHTSWSLEKVTFGPAIEAPLHLSVKTVGTPGTRTLNYVVTAVDLESTEESLASDMATITTAKAAMSDTDYNELTCKAKEGVTDYNFYRLKNGVKGFIGKGNLVGDFKAFAITAATKANPCEITAAEHTFVDGEQVVIDGVTGMVELNGNTYTVDNAAADTFELTAINSSAYTDYVSGGMATIAVVYQDNDDPDPDLQSTPPVSKNPFPAEADYPSAVAFFEQRLGYATGEVIRMSGTANLENFNISNPLKDDDAVTFKLASTEANFVHWIVPLKEMILGTNGGIWKVTGMNNEALTPGSIDAKQQASRGASDIQPLVVGPGVLFMQRGNGVLRELAYDIYTDGYKDSDVSVLSEHILRDSPAVAMAYQQIPSSLVWVIQESGEMRAMIYFREHDVIGWSRIVTDGEVESVATIPGDEGTDDQVWISVRRFRKYVGWDWLVVAGSGGTASGLEGDGFVVQSGVTFEAGLVVQGQDLEGETAWFKYTGGLSFAGDSEVTFVEHPAAGDEIEVVFHGCGTLNAEKWELLTYPYEYRRYIERLAPIFRVQDLEDVNYSNMTYPYNRLLDPAAARMVDSGLTLDLPLTVTWISQENPATVTCAAHGLSAGNKVRLYDAEATDDDGTVVTHPLSVAMYTVSNPTTDTFQLAGIDNTEGLRFWGSCVARKCVTTLSGLEHLHGRTVSILSDGFTQPDVVVGDATRGWLPGTIQIAAAGLVHVGLPYTSELRPMRPDIIQPDGSTLGRMKQVTNLWIHFYQTVGAEVGEHPDRMQEVGFREASLPGNVPIPLFTGVKNPNFDGTASRNAQVIIRQTKPLPQTILSVTQLITFMDG